jgi:P-type conjugative transfer protein TrbJ
MIRTSRRAAAVLSLLICYPGGGYATVFGNGGALETTQILNMAELIKIALDTYQTAQTVHKQLEDMYIQGSQLTNADWGNAGQALQQLAQVVQQGNALAYSTTTIDATFRDKFNLYEDYLIKRPDFDGSMLATKYRDWSDTNRDTIASTMASVGLQNDQYASEEATMETLQMMSQNSVGRLQAIQAGNQIAAQQVRQIQKLRQLMMTQMQMQSAFMATQSDKEAVQTAQSELYYGKPVDARVGNETAGLWRN